MGNPQDPYAPYSDDRSSAPQPPPAGWPGGADGPMHPVRAARPGTLVAAVIFWVLAGLTLLLVGAVTVAAAGTQQFIDAFADSVAASSQMQVSDMLIKQVGTAVGLSMLVLGLLIVVLGLLLLGRMNWARIVVTVLGALGALVVWPALFVLLAIVLQFLPSSNAWFRARAAAAMNR